jgi:hypothetical protein
MKTRLLTCFVAVSFALVFSLGAAAQFPKIKKPKEEKPAPAPTESKEEAKPAASAASSDTLKKVTWADNGISFEVPDNWEQSSLDNDNASFSLPNNPDGVNFSANISRLGKDFPADQSLKAYRDGAAKEKGEGKLASWADQNIGAAKGLNQLEAAKGDDICRLTWIGFQNRGGWNMIIVHFSTKGSAMSKHEATFRKVLGTFKVE